MCFAFMIENVAYIATKEKGNVAKMNRDRSSSDCYVFAMLSEWLQMALDEAGMNQAELARRLTERLGRSIDRAAVNKMTKGQRGMYADELIAIESITGYSAPKNAEVRLVGVIGAGAEIYTSGEELNETVQAPLDFTPQTVAVRVDGDSMLPAFRSGAIIYYSRHLPPSDLVNNYAIVCLEDDRVFLKVLRFGSAPDLWTLSSINASYSDIIDVCLRWAAPIDWVKP